MRISLTRDDVARILARDFGTRYSGALVTIPTDGGLVLEWKCDWQEVESDTPTDAPTPDTGRSAPEGV